MVATSLLRVMGVAPALRSTAIRGMPSTLLRAACVSPMMRRSVQTESITSQEHLRLLNEQRSKRALSPHLTIYQPQLTAVLSGLNRITGVALSGGLYLGAIAFVFHPLFPSMGSEAIVSWFHELPAAVRISSKFILALPFTFHSFNGIRHLCWDMGMGLTLKAVYASGWTVVAATLLSSAWFAFF